MKALLRDLQDRAAAGPLDTTKPPPDDFGPPGQLWTQGVYVPYQERLSDDRVWNKDQEAPDERDRRHKKLADCRAWEADERARFDALRQKAETEAQARAKSRIPSSIDISLLGGGWAFLLEFSTVIVIIFTLLALGIAGSVDGKDITTILASIAGYVLGKATSSSRQAGGGAKAPEE